MKYRKDFVTNSSSSSFVCEICGHSEAVWDGCAEDAGFQQCENGHVFCDEHMISDFSRADAEQRLISDGHYDSEYLKDFDDEDLFCLYREVYEGVPECMCPICSFDEYSDEDMAAYLLKMYGVSRDEVFAEVRMMNHRRRKLYDSEYITYVAKMKNIYPDKIAAGWKDEFGSYAEFSKFIYS